MTKRLLIVANRCPWQSWPWKVAKLKQWFSPAFHLTVDITHTYYDNVPFVDYVSSDGQPGFGVEENWYNLNVTARAHGFDLVLFVLPTRQWPDKNFRGWRTNNHPSGAWEMQMVADENEHRFKYGKDQGDAFFFTARHEIMHALYAMTKQPDMTHYWEEREQLEQALKQIAFNMYPLSRMQKTIDWVLAQVERIKKRLAEIAQEQQRTTLLDALIQVESGGDDNAIGDVTLIHKAYGPLQIRQPYVDDVNRVHGTNHNATDCLGNRTLSIDIYDKYMAIYATERRLGRPVTDEDRARIHNGGPDGYKKVATLPYWRKVENLLV